MNNTTKPFENVLLTKEESIATITPNRPQSLNAMSPELMQELKEAAEIVGEDEATRAVIVTGAAKSFCAG